jgi:PAS domain S-box-containing protein
VTGPIAAFTALLGLVVVLALLLLREWRRRRTAELRAEVLFEAAPFGVLILDPQSHRLLGANDRVCQELGYSRDELLRMTIAEVDVLGSSEALRQRGRAHRIGPDTQEFEAQHRAKDGTVRDMLVRVRGARLDGRDITYGAHFDITARKQAEQERALLLAEVDHRSRNLLAVVQAALRLIPRTDAQSYARAVEERVLALGRAHTLLSQGRWRGVDLEMLANAELAGFLDGRAPGVVLRGPAVTLPAGVTQGLAMILHELATNATKHGALSRPGGQVTLTWEVPAGAPELRLCWTERGGPPVAMPPTRRGFGSRMLEVTLGTQLGGRLQRHWVPEGLVCEMQLPLNRHGTDMLHPPTGVTLRGPGTGSAGAA